MTGSTTGIDSLIRSLENGDDAAAKALANMGVQVLDPLILKLETSERSFRDGIVWILAEIGPAGIPRLLASLEHGSPTVKTAVAEILGSIAEPAATEALIAALKDIDADVRNGAAWALVRIGLPAAARLIPLLEDRSELARESAFWCLSGLGDAAVGPMMDALRDAGGMLRKNIMRVLIDIKEPSVQPLIMLLGHEDAEMRMLAAEALGAIGDKRAVPALTARLGNDEREVRIRCVEALAAFGEQAFSGLREALTGTDAAVRDDVFSVLGLCRKISSGMLAEFAGNPDADLRRRALRMSGIIKDASAARYCMEALRDPDFTVRDMAAWALGETGDPGAAEILLESLGDDAQDIRFSQSAWALARLSSPPVIEKLVLLLRHRCGAVRWRSALALGIIRDRSAVEPLLQALEMEKSEMVANRIIISLGDLGDVRAVPALRNLLVHDDGTGYLLIKETISRIRSAPRPAPFPELSPGPALPSE
jgi:HEAT repeat protein